MDDLDFPTGSLPDTDPDVIVGMSRLRVLRELEDIELSAEKK